MSDPATFDEEPDDFYDNGYEDDPLDLFESFDCGMDRHGNCGKAGSEECDWECPYRNVKMNRKAGR